MAVAVVAGFAIRHSPERPPASAPVVAEPTSASAPVGFVDVPAGASLVSPQLRVSGWALDTVGVDRVEIRIDGEPAPRRARYGIARADVAQVKPGYPDSSASGFSFEGEFARADAPRTPFTVVAVSRSGSETVLARKSIVPARNASIWTPLLRERASLSSPPFYFLMATSGVGLGGAREIDTHYRPYVSETVKIGMRVPILYLRTTQGAAADWHFDPGWDVERRCGERRIAEDSLGATIDHAIKHRIPVLFTLNGGVWADATCDVPDWDVNDHLERDARNCQWNENNQVMADDYLRHLPGSQDAPELARSLSFNVYNARVRSYKKRNLQQAGALIASFAREHPELFVGVTLDPDTYHNPFFEEKQWYDYNPGTLRQFRDWLRGAGPYAGKGEEGLPDLRTYRRSHPLTLHQVNGLAGRKFSRWEDVDPPRRFSREPAAPFWKDAWGREWELFRRHLVDLHYDELSRWLIEAGIGSAHIYSSQGFMAPAGDAIRSRSRCKARRRTMTAEACRWRAQFRQAATSAPFSTDRRLSTRRRWRMVPVCFRRSLAWIRSGRWSSTTLRIFAIRRCFRRTRRPTAACATCSTTARAFFHPWRGTAPTACTRVRKTMCRSRRGAIRRSRRRCSISR